MTINPSRQKLKLVSLALVMIAIMAVFVPWVTLQFGAGRGALVVFLLYWFGFCLPIGLWFVGVKNLRSFVGLTVGNHKWVRWAIGGQVALVCLGSWMLRPENIPFMAVILAVIFGIINGFSEELFWRGAFLAQGRNDIWFQGLGVVLFTLWHVPLTLAHGIIFEGGGAALVGGAFLLGLFWSVIAQKTGQIGWPMIGHILTNIAAFIGLFSVNFF